jgi:hypothetical protein
MEKIYKQLDKQQKTYKTYGNVKEIYGTYRTANTGYFLYNLFFESDNHL